MHYLITTHSEFHERGKDIYGPASHMFDFLKKQEKSVTFIRHCIKGKYPSIIADQKNSYEKGKWYQKNLLLRSLEHSWINLREGFHQKEKIYYVGTDPVNSLGGALLKILRRTEKNIFLTADYAEERFKNRFLNWFYHTLDRFCLRHADEVWSVSSRIVQNRTRLGVPPEKNKLLPNSPKIKEMPLQKYDGNLHLVVVGNLTKGLQMEPIFHSMERIRIKGYDVFLDIIGDGPHKALFEQQAGDSGIASAVKFWGAKKHDEVIEIISRSFLGFALYSGHQSWNRYGDSMKAREYVACGIPVIINMVPSTADDIKKYEAGLVLEEIEEEKIMAFIIRCIENREWYQQMRHNARILGENFDKEKILKNLFAL